MLTEIFGTWSYQGFHTWIKTASPTDRDTSIAILIINRAICSGLNHFRYSEDDH